MTVSKHGLDTLPLVSTVNQTVDMFILDWQLAALQALTTFNPPDDSDANRQWWIAFAGNMLWAWTIFCPQGSIVAAAGSLIGAALAAGAASKLSGSPPEQLSSPAGKLLIMIDLVRQASEATVMFKTVVPNWSKDVLLPEIMRQASDYLERTSFQFQMRKNEYLRANSNVILTYDFFLHDDELIKWFNGNDGGSGDEFIRSFIWYNLMFLAGKVPYETRRMGLHSYFGRLLHSLQEQLEAQRDLYEYYMRAYMKDHVGDGIPGMLDALETYKISHPFMFKPFYGIHPRGDRLTAVFR